jgi:hypothetical protein
MSSRRGPVKVAATGSIRNGPARPRADLSITCQERAATTRSWASARQVEQGVDFIALGGKSEHVSVIPTRRINVAHKLYDTTVHVGCITAKERCLWSPEISERSKNLPEHRRLV